MPTYEVTCTFGSPGYGTPGEAVDRLLDSVGSMRAEGIEIEHREVTIDRSGDDGGPAMHVRFSAPTQGTVGRHVCRARLPAGGIRRVE